MPTPFDSILPRLTRQTRKWDNYYEAYHRHFARFIGNAPTVLEIGVENGGSLETWAKYFGKGAQIIGIDIEPHWRFVSPEENIRVITGDQGSQKFLDLLVKHVPRPDIVIDDGSHVSADVILTFKTLFPPIPSGGVYLCEDLACSYLSTHSGGYRKSGTSIEFFKNLIDDMNGNHNGRPTPYTRSIASMSVYDQIVVIEKTTDRPRCDKQRSP